MGYLIPLAIILLIFGGAGFYVSFRLYQGIAAFLPGMKLWPFLVAMGLLMLLSILEVVQVFSGFPPMLKHVLLFINAIFMGVFLYLFLYTATADIVMLAPKLLKLPFTTHHLFKGFVTLTVVVFTVVTCGWGFVNARQIDLIHYDIELQGKKDISDMNIVMLSDVHLGSAGSESRLADIVAEVNALKPDVICIAGDFFDTNYGEILDPDAAISTLQGLRSTYGTYACFGNHDAGSTVGQMKEFLEKAGINLLEDESITIDDRLVIVGRMDSSPIGGYADKTRGSLSDFFTVEDPTLPVIVLDHNPKNIDEYGEETDLVLCGHTHRGQMFPGSLITGRIYKVDHGYYREDAQSPQVIVTSGVGYWGPPMRVGTDSEIVSLSFSS